MTTNLATIEKTVSARLAAERENPPIPASVMEKAEAESRRTVAGFAVIDEARKLAVIERETAATRDDIRARVDGYVKHADELREILAARSIVPLAVLPRKAWFQICAAAGLIHLGANTTGRVRLNIKRAEKRVYRMLDDDHVTSFFSRHKRKTEMTERDVDKFIGSLPWGDFLELVGDREEFGCVHLTEASIGGAESLLSEYIATGLVLPTPPADVLAILTAAAELQPQTFAVAEAIGFTESLAALITRSRRELEQRRIAIERDPIVHVEHGTAAAIIAQFGDFPIELDAIDKATRVLDLERPRKMERGQGGPKMPRKLAEQMMRGNGPTATDMVRAEMDRADLMRYAEMSRNVTTQERFNRMASVMRAQGFTSDQIANELRRLFQ